MTIAKLRQRMRSLTLIELLITISIIVILTAFLIPQVSVLRRKAYISNTKAFIKKIESALSLYYDQFLDYPPDGFDGNAKADAGYTYSGGGVRLGSNYPGGLRSFKNTGCLVYFLCFPITKVTIVGATVKGTTSKRNTRTEKVGPFLTELVSSNFSFGEGFELNQIRTDANNAQVEFVDAWGRPLEYDKVRTRDGYFQNDVFNKSGGVFANSARAPHWQVTGDFTGVEDGEESDCGVVEALDTIFDPRRALNQTTGCVDTTKPAGPKNAGSFDLWSHGQFWSDPTDDIGTWNIN